jgi:hypothetical protein
MIPIRNSPMYWQWQMQNDRRTLWALVAFIFSFRIPLSLLPPSVVECGNSDSLHLAGIKTDNPP